MREEKGRGEGRGRKGEGGGEGMGEGRGEGEGGEGRSSWLPPSQSQCFQDLTILLIFMQPNEMGMIISSISQRRKLRHQGIDQSQEVY